MRRMITLIISIVVILYICKQVFKLLIHRQKSTDVFCSDCSNAKALKIKNEGK